MFTEPRQYECMACRTAVRQAIHFFVNFDIFKWLYLAYYRVYLHQTWGFFKSRCVYSDYVDQLVANPIIYRLVPSPDGHQHGGRKPTETSVIEFCYKSVNLSLEELIKIILFLMREPAQTAKFPEIMKSRNKSLFNQLGRHVNAASHKILEIQA